MRTLYSLCLVLLATTFSFGQDLKGNVSSNGEPIVGGYLYTPDQEIHAHTDLAGNFTCKGLSVGDSLFVSHIGFSTLLVVLDAASFASSQNYELKEQSFNLDQVFISNELKTPYTVTEIDLQIRPVANSQQVLRAVPGLFIGQHAGGGKAEQIFLRGFDIDHGTDISLTVDGMPVNMVSHAHGQGYADLHFVIPETIEEIDFGKGPYYANQGNFNTAGYVDFKTKDKVSESKFGIEYGQFNTGRIFGLFDLISDENSNKEAYIATEYLQTDGPFDSPQNFNRFNIMGKYIVNFQNSDKLSVQFSRFQSKWDASGQIPQRLVDNGTIDRFGAVDDTEGGSTSRTNAAIEYTKSLDNHTFLKLNSYFVHYDFELFSNFTFFLDDRENGDQIQQFEDRNIYGVQAQLFNTHSFDQFDLEFNGGVGMRYDDVNDNQLSFTTNRKAIRERLAFGNVDETNMYAFADVKFDFGNFLINPSLRFDLFEFNYVDNLQTAYSTQSNSSGIVSPKLNLIYNPSNNWQIFLKSGLGFHSNDTRVVVAQQGVETLPYAFGNDLGFVWKPTSRLWISSALWQLYLQQEFVYVGDAAIVEPSGETQRYGIEVALRLQLTDKLFFDTDFTKTVAESVNDPEGENRIPLAPDMTATGGLSYNDPSGFSGGLRYRYMNDRPANEDFSITALGYFVLDANVSYRYKDITFGLMVENITDTEWNEAQFATESQLLNEDASVEELHFTPGTPLAIRGSISYSF
ncbi:MAG: TonB-dependent receptor [Bacteroidota bacterium]